ncbi:MAG: 2,3-diphosphoglycerate synthetase [Thermoleophilia bacterium]|nr:2,3-diphosphoglycerate synthetase [Thermoleophilia bacterium]
MRAVAVIDGEHYAAVVRDALVELPYDIVGCVLVGGTEKLRGGEDYGVPLLASLEEAIVELAPDVVLDLSDEPVLGPPARFRLAARVLALGIPYEGADFRFDPPRFEPSTRPSIAVIGTGKRVGKTAVTGHVAGELARERSVVVVAMGRGGPPEPELVEVRPTVADLLRISRAGLHAASDHLETAALTGVPTIGCRRCGGGLAGAVGTSNVLAGVRLAEKLEPDLIVLDGSGAALPPIAADRRILIVGAHQDSAVTTGYLNPYRALLADLVIVTMAEKGTAHGELATAMAGLTRPGVPIVRVVLRPRPLEDVRGRRVAFFGTAPTTQHAQIAEHLEQMYEGEVVHVSGSLSDRAALRSELSGLDCDVIVVEIKAAAIDVVAEEAARMEIPVVLAANDVLPLAGEPDLGVELDRLASEAIATAAVGV